MKNVAIIEEIQSCIDCMECLDACDTYLVTNDELKSPNGRLKIAHKIFMDEKITDEEKIGIYTCTLCASCDLICSESIGIANIVHASKIALAERGEGPLDNHEKIIKGILEKDNSVGGKPEERLNWIPQEYRDGEIYEKKDSDTLLFLGCMSSFRVKESASAPYEILKRVNYDFKILEKEPCCGEYVYSAGKLDLAKKIFQENIELFKKLGVKNLIVTCGGCLYAFDTVYRKYFKSYEIKVRHVVDVIHELVKEGQLKLRPLNRTITYHDPCRLGRKYKNGPLFDESREILEKCGIEVRDLSADHQRGPCCGAGSGIRGVDSSICIKIGANLFDNMETKELASSCPLCVFNFRYVNYKNQTEKEGKYITDYILEAIEK